MGYSADQSVLLFTMGQKRRLPDRAWTWPPSFDTSWRWLPIAASVRAASLSAWFVSS